MPQPRLMMVAVMLAFTGGVRAESIGVNFSKSTMVVPTASL